MYSANTLSHIKKLDEIFKHVEDVEIVVTDDNSNDGTESLFTSFYSSTLNIFSSSSKFITPGNN